MVLEKVLKIILIIMIIYVAWRCFNMREFFTDTLTNKKMIFTANNVKYVLISFDEMKQEYQDKIISELLSNNDYMNNKENEFYVKNKKLYKTPLYLVKETEVNKYVTNNTLSFTLVKDGNQNGKDYYGFNPVINNKQINDKYIYYNYNLGLLFYGIAGGDIVHAFIDGFLKNKYLKPLNDGLYTISDTGNDIISLSVI